MALDWINDIYNSIPDGSNASVEYEYDEELGGWWAHIYDGNGNHVNDSYLPDPDSTPDPGSDPDPDPWPEPDPEPGAGIDGDGCPACGSDPCICDEGNEGNENTIQRLQRCLNWRLNAVLKLLLLNMEL